MTDCPNILIVGVPRGGTSIAAAMLNNLGWHFAADANWGGEPASVMKLFKEENLSDVKVGAALEHVLARTPEPWVIKVPNLVLYPGAMEIANCFNPTLLWMTRSLPSVKTSWINRGHRPMGDTVVAPNGLTVEQWAEKAGAAFAAWRGSKVKIAYRDLQRAISLWLPGKTP